MDQIFDRLGRLIRSFSEKESSASTDPDQLAAEDELEEFLKTGKERPARPQQQGHKSYQHTRTTAVSMDPEIRAAYSALELSADSSWEEINAAHKKLLMNYHPDRHAADPAKFKDATLKSQKINEAFQKLKKHLGR